MSRKRVPGAARAETGEDRCRLQEPGKQAQPHEVPGRSAGQGSVSLHVTETGSWPSLETSGGPCRCSGSRSGVGRGEARTRGGAAGRGGRQAGAALTLRAFSMLTSQPSKRRTWAIRTSWSATAWYERSSPARKASHCRPPSCHSVMNVPAGRDRRGQAFPPTPRPAVRSPGPAAAASLRPANPSGLQTLGWESDTLGPSRGRQQAGEGPGCRRTLKKHGCTQGWATTACFYKRFYWNAAAHFLACHPWRLLPHEWSQQ